MFYNTARSICLLFCGLCLLFPCTQIAAELEGFPVPYWPYYPEAFSLDISLSHTEGKGLGYSQGYSSLDFSLFEPLYNDRLVTQLDLRGHAFNNGQHASNVGLAFRWLDQNMIWGISSYCDYYRSRHRSYNQFFAGLEALANQWEFRLNSYIPFGRTHFKRVDHRRMEVAMNGIDFSAGYRCCTDWFNLLVGITPYCYWRKSDRTKNTHALGSGIFAHALFFEHLFLNARASWDSLFHWTSQICVGFHIPFDLFFKTIAVPRSCNCLADRLYSPVLRNDIIVTDRHGQ